MSQGSLWLQDGEEIKGIREDEGRQSVWRERDQVEGCGGNLGEDSGSLNGCDSRNSSKH